MVWTNSTGLCLETSDCHHDTNHQQSNMLSDKTNHDHNLFPDNTHFEFADNVSYMEQFHLYPQTLLNTSGLLPVPGHDAGAKPWPFLKQPLSMIVILTVAYLVVFVLGVTNNSLVVSVIYRNRQLRTVTNYFIANLALADILVCTMMPVTLLANVIYEWWYGAALCKAAPYIQGVAAGASVNTLAAVAMERYLAIFYPSTKRLSAQSACAVIALIWIVPMCIFIPWIVVYTQITYRIHGYNYVICTAQWASSQQRKMFSLFVIFLTCYLLPLIFIAIFYFLIGIRVWKRKVRGMRGSAQRNINRRKARIVRMLIVVFVIFFLSWLPLYAIEFRTLFGPILSSTESKLFKNYLFPFAQWLGASNSCVNPFIYVYFSKKFRRSVLAALRSKECCGKITA